MVLSVVFNVLTSTVAGFAISKGRFPGKGIALLIILSNMMVPFESKLLPIYSIIRGIGLNNTFLGVILPSVMTNAMYIFFVKTYCDSLPDDLYEAGRVDGANLMRIYSQVYLPLLTPIIATIVVLDSINVWNDLLWPMIVMTKQSNYTVQIGLQIYNSGSAGATHAGNCAGLIGDQHHSAVGYLYLLPEIHCSKYCFFRNETITIYHNSNRNRGKKNEKNIVYHQHGQQLYGHHL